MCSIDFSLNAHHHVVVVDNEFYLTSSQTSWACNFFHLSVSLHVVSMSPILFKCSEIRKPFPGVIVKINTMQPR